MGMNVCLAIRIVLVLRVPEIDPVVHAPGIVHSARDDPLGTGITMPMKADRTTEKTMRKKVVQAAGIIMRRKAEVEVGFLGTKNVMKNEVLHLTKIVEKAKKVGPQGTVVMIEGTIV